MFIQLIDYIFLVAFSLLPLKVTTQIFNCNNTTETICGGNGSFTNGHYSKYECSAYRSTSASLPSCVKENNNEPIYWYWYDDVCRTKHIRDALFVTVNATDYVTCQSKPTVNISYHSCMTDYAVNRQSMTIKNTTDSRSHKYICGQGKSVSVVPNNSTIIYFINILGKNI